MMENNNLAVKIKAFWNEKADSEWYRSLRSDAVISGLQDKPETAFHPAVYALIRKYLPNLKGARVLLGRSHGLSNPIMTFCLSCTGGFRISSMLK